MAYRPTVRQQWILSYLGENPGATLKEIANDSPIHRQKTFELREKHPTMVRAVVRSVEYGTAQQAIARLIEVGLVLREPEGRKPADGPYRHFLASPHVLPESEDPLEQAFALEWKS